MPVYTEEKMRMKFPEITKASNIFAIKLFRSFLLCRITRDDTTQSYSSTVDGKRVRALDKNLAKLIFFAVTTTKQHYASLRMSSTSAKLKEIEILFLLFPLFVLVKLSSSALFIFIFPFLFRLAAVRRNTHNLS